jgi:arylsulfatase A-like enzyme
MLLLVAIALLGIHPSYATNYLVVIADDLGVDKVGAWQADFPGYAEAAQWMPATPTVDALASSGLRFTRAWALTLCMNGSELRIRTGWLVIRLVTIGS